MKKVMILDAFPVWREGIKSILCTDHEFEVTLETPDESLVRAELARRNSDLAILDLDIPGGDGFEILRLIRTSESYVPVLIFSALAEELYGVRALKEGASGYLVKSCSRLELLNAIRKVGEGKKYISDRLAQRLANFVENGEKSLPHERLTMREFQVMLMLGQGMSPKEVADKLSLSYTTVTTHKSKILDKMELDSVAQIIRYVSTEGLTK